MKTHERRGSGFDENYWHFINEENLLEASSTWHLKPERVIRDGLGMSTRKSLLWRLPRDVMETAASCPGPIKESCAAAVGNPDAIHIKGNRPITTLSRIHFSSTETGAVRYRLGISWDFLHDGENCSAAFEFWSAGYIGRSCSRAAPPSVRSDIYLLDSFHANVSGTACGINLDSGVLQFIPRLYIISIKCLAADLQAVHVDSRGGRSVAGIAVEQELAITLESSTPCDDMAPGIRVRVIRISRICLNILKGYSIPRRYRWGGREVFCYLQERKATRIFYRPIQYVEWPRGFKARKGLRRCGYTSNSMP